MPYIQQEQRKLLGPHVEDAAWVAETAGQLNYVITRVIDAYYRRFGPSYVTLNEILGVLECVKAEFYRRVAAPYEDQKCHDNGDVYG